MPPQLHQTSLIFFTYFLSFFPFWPSSNSSFYSLAPSFYVHQNILVEPLAPLEMHLANNKQALSKLNVESGHNLHTNKWKKKKKNEHFELTINHQLPYRFLLSTIDGMTL